LVDEGKTGHLVPIRSPENIATAISTIIAERKNIDEIRKLCQKKAKQYTWLSYAQNIINFNLSNSTQRFEIA
jgi:glycosyltransferase involved in cell wall biosynthesis